jgi:hypothetical protein
MGTGNGDVEIAKEPLKVDRVDPSANDNYLIWRCSENGHFEITKLESNAFTTGNDEVFQYI